MGPSLALGFEFHLIAEHAVGELASLDLGGHFRREIRMEEVHTDAGLALDKGKNIYVSDPQLSGIQVFAYDGKLLYRFGRNGTGAGDLDTPSGLWLEAEKKLYVADTKNKRVEEFAIERGK